MWRMIRGSGFNNLIWRSFRWSVRWSVEWNVEWSVEWSIRWSVRWSVEWAIKIEKIIIWRHQMNVRLNLLIVELMNVSLRSDIELHSSWYHRDHEFSHQAWHFHWHLHHQHLFNQNSCHLYLLCLQFQDQRHCYSQCWWNYWNQDIKQTDDWWAQLHHTQEFVFKFDLKLRRTNLKDLMWVDSAHQCYKRLY